MRKTKQSTISIDDNLLKEVKIIIKNQTDEKYNSVSHFVREAVRALIKLTKAQPQSK